MWNMFWIGGPTQDIPQDVQQQVADVVQETAPAANEAIQLIGLFKGIASALYMDVWWLTIATFSFVWAVRRILNFVEIDTKKPPRILEVIRLKKGWWPALRDFLWGTIAVVFASTVSAVASRLAPCCLPDIHWIVLGPVYGLGAVFMYLALKRLGWIGQSAK